MPQLSDRWDTWDPEERGQNRRYPEQTSVPVETPTGGGSEPTPDYGTFEWPSFEGSYSPSYHFGSVPMFDAPEFYAPTQADAEKEAGYQFRLDAGRQALERGAAARGTLRTGGTLKDILEYGQKFGAQEYANVFDRAMRAYATRYQGAKDEYAPLFAQYNNQFSAEQARALAAFQREYDLYNAQLENARFQESLISGAMQTPPPTFPGGG